MKSRIFLVLLLLLNGSLIGISQEANNEKLLETFHSISSNEILGFVEELSSEKYEGRLSGSPEYMDASRWCASKFEEWGIAPANKGSYFQYFPNEYSDVLELGEVVYTNKGQATKLKFPEEYLPGSNSDSGTLEAGLVYVGHGITAPELGYDDYKNVDVKGKIIILETGTPYTKNDPELARWTPYAYHRYKFRNAVKHGAAGMIYASKIANPNTVHLDGFIYAHVEPKIVEQIFIDAGKNYSTVKKQLKQMETPSFTFPANQTVKITAKTKYHPDAKACNVVGMIEGSDPNLKDEVIIVGGHLDGQGQMGDVMFPSALDNASGVADILAAAKAFAQLEVKPKRSILFILIGGEECGLYGSKQYTDQPLFPVEKTRMMINLDMVGNGTGFFLTGGKTYTDLYRHFELANNKWIHRSLQTNEVTKNYGRPRSDASNFENAGIPTFGLWTRNSVFPVYYHDPRDKTDVLTPEIMEDAAKLLFLGISGIANDETL
ncbi:M28 family peptidase [Maribellus mangrovi]|uniref:M28 family peptidase n=1 Tax=Maribellus mangrovi TaxID=3133146 RepID=UPI0030EE17BF